VIRLPRFEAVKQAAMIVAAVAIQLAVWSMSRAMREGGAKLRRIGGGRYLWRSQRQRS
jgi:hypothetical protein